MFLPRKIKVFDKLVEQSSIVRESAQRFREITNSFEDLDNGQFEDLERRSDDLVHDITDSIEKIFIMPLDKEDIKELSEALDDIVDNLEQVVNRLCIFKVKDSNQYLKEFSALIEKAVNEVCRGILMIKEHKISSDDFLEVITKLHEIENYGDRLHRNILERMLGDLSVDFARDPISIIKWKEVFQTLEDTLDRCEDLAALFGRLRVKYG